MEYIHGKQTFVLELSGLSTRLAGYKEVLVDVGTGDGSYARQLAAACPATFVIGLDACRENLRQASRSPQPNLLYLIANATGLPPELYGLAAGITVNFPWGSLLEGLLDYRSGVLDGLYRLAAVGAWLEIRLNSSAWQGAGLNLQQGGEVVRGALRQRGFQVEKLLILDRAALRSCSTTWAKRLGYGRDPQACYLLASR